MSTNAIDDLGFRAAAIWLAAQFPHISRHDRAPLVRGLAGILYPYMQTAATADLSDALADQFPAVAEGLDRSVAERVEAHRRGDFHA